MWRKWKIVEGMSYFYNVLFFDLFAYILIKRKFSINALIYAGQLAEW